MLPDQNVVLVLIDFKTSMWKYLRKFNCQILVTLNSEWRNSFIYFYEWNFFMNVESMTANDGDY